MEEIKKNKNYKIFNYKKPLLKLKKNKLNLFTKICINDKMSNLSFF